MATPNRWLFSLSRLLKGYHPVFLEYAVDMRPRWTGPRGNPHLDAILRAKADVFSASLQELTDMMPVVQALCDDRLEGVTFNWRNGFLPALDALTVMHAACSAKSTFFEIGSGNSTSAARAAIQHFGLDTRIISVDPEPREEIDLLCDEVLRSPVEEIDLDRITALEPGDVLFIDSSHRSFMNSDVTVLMLEVLPVLKPGVLIGIHDILLPYDYPDGWKKRAYNEQYMLGAMLIANPGYFDITFANQWIAREGMHKAPLVEVWSLLGEDIRDRGGSAFWGYKAG